MNKEEFYNIISDSNLLINIDEQSIDEIIKEFPYFQTAYILKTKILSKKGSFKYDNFIKLASLYSINRSKLYNYIHNEPNDVKKNKIKTEKKIKPIEIDKKQKIENTTVKKKDEPVKTKPIEVEPITIKNVEQEKSIEIVKKEKERKNIIAKTESVKAVSELQTKPKEKPISANASLAEKIIHKYKNSQKDNTKESIADIILRKAAEAKKAKKTKPNKTNTTLKNKPKEINVERKIFKPVIVKTRTTEEVKPIKKETPKNKHLEFDILSEINKITKETVITDYFDEKEIPKDNPVKKEMSFEQWLNFVETPLQTSSKNKKQLNLIDKFISANTDIKINPNNDIEGDKEELVKNSEIERDDFITETLANIYIKQKLYEKAISAFTKLSLKYPEKNSYFADRIKKIEKLIKK